MSAKKLFQEAILNSPSRLKALHKSGMLEAGPNEIFDFLVEKACFDLRTPIGFISLLEPHRQLFKSYNGLPRHVAEAGEMPLSHSLCLYVVCGGEPLAINDLRDNPHFSQHPAHIDFDIMSYLGEPLYYEGEIIGAVCAMHFRPRRWTETEKKKLRLIAQDIQAEMYFRHFPALD